ETTLAQLPANAAAPAVAPGAATPTLANTALPNLAPTATATAVPATPTSTATPFLPQTSLPVCGQLLPLLPQNNTPSVTNLSPDAALLATVTTTLPEAARPAWEYLLENPGSVGLVAYRVG